MRGTAARFSKGENFQLNDVPEGSTSCALPHLRWPNSPRCIFAQQIVRRRFSPLLAVLLKFRSSSLEI
jgi:hypothetical protein